MRFEELLTCEIWTRACPRQQMLLNPVRDEVGIPETVRMMRCPILDHDGDAATQLLITILDRQRVVLEQKIRAATNIQQCNIVPRQLSQPCKSFRTNPWIVRVNAGN